MEAEQVPLSALQHWAYCPRQCALIHLEQAFDDNLHTLRGNALHAICEHAAHAYQPRHLTGRHQFGTWNARRARPAHETARLG